MALTDTAIRHARPGDKPVKLSDEKGLYLLIHPNGGKWWRFDYRFGDKRKTLSMGVYPDVSLKDARERRDQARKLLAQDIDPGENRKVQKAAKQERAANSFEVVAREWFAKNSPRWAKSHADKIIARLENDVFPWLGEKPIAEIKAPDLLVCLRRIEDRGAVDTAHRAQQNCGQVFRYAIATGQAEHDISADLRGALPPAKSGNFAAITEPAKVGALLRAMDAVNAGFIVKCALRLAPLVFVRPGELRTAQWADIDLEGAEWRYFVTKTKTSHSVPLATQAVAILGELHPLTGQGRYLFPGARDKDQPMSGGAIGMALRRAGYNTREEHTGHGFRAMARTILHEELEFDREVIEHQLAHRVPDALGNAYNRTKFIKQRRAMMQEWADYLDKLKAAED
ncbi:MAG: integrase arm-type DNA-binding domain-containing protein [Zoogloeaceae bacterium]|nr:integrase arm-type DNA-binding domain-containing protein [Zoogloeaceae bacterium]